MTQLTEIYVRAVVGHEALALVDRVEWDGLQHAFANPEHIAGTSQRGTSLDYHPKRALEKLAAADDAAFRMAKAALYQSVCHQGGTIYEATPYAVPFLAAFVAGADTPPARARAAGELVACMGMASCFVSERGRGFSGWASNLDWSDGPAHPEQTSLSPLVAFERGFPRADGGRGAGTSRGRAC